MNINYDPKVNALSIRFRDDPISESDEIRPGVIVDYNAAGEVVAMEILDASAVLQRSKKGKRPIAVAH